MSNENMKPTQCYTIFNLRRQNSKFCLFAFFSQQNCFLQVNTKPHFSATDEVTNSSTFCFYDDCQELETVVSVLIKSGTRVPISSLCTSQ